MMAIRISDIICLTSRWIMVCPFPPRFLNRVASFFDLWLYVLWPRHNVSLPAKTVRHASLCLYFGVWIIVSPLSLSEARRISVFSALYIYGYCNFMRVLSLITVCAAPVIGERERANLVFRLARFFRRCHAYRISNSTSARA